MNKIFILFLAIQSLLFIEKANSQLVLHVEQISGVTTSLNSVAVTHGNFDPDQVWACGDSGVVLKTTDLGNSWARVGSGIIPPTVKLINIFAKSPDSVLVSGVENNIALIYLTFNGGINWTQVFSQTGGKINGIWMMNPNNGFMVGDPVGGRWSLWKTTNKGVNWDSAGLYIPQVGLEKGFSNSLAVMYDYIWFGTNNSHLYKSTNNGSDWNMISTSPEVNSSAVWVYHDTVSYAFALFGGNNAFKSTNGGLNWQQIDCPDTSGFRGFCPTYLGALDFKPMASISIRNNRKVYYQDNSSAFDTDYVAPSGNYNHMAYDDRYMYWNFTWAVRSNGGITRISLNRGGAVRSLSNVIPTGYRLEQNYPNPFNPETKIRFNIPRFKNTQSGMVSIVIYDVQGREVDRALNQAMNPGEYELSYNASKLCSGVYFYRLTTENFTQSMKMILIK